MERLKARLYDGHGRARHHRRGGRRDLREDGGVRQLRLPRIAQRVVQLPRVRVVVDQVPRAGRVLCGAAERPADGVLEPALAVPGRPPPRGGGALARPERARWRRPRSSRARTAWAGWRCAWGSVRCAASAPNWRRHDRGRSAVRVAGRSGAPGAAADRRPSSRRWPPPVCSSECFGLRASRGAVGGGCGGAVATRSAGGHRDRRAGTTVCRAWTEVETAVADLWATGVAPTGHPTQFLRDRAAAAGRGHRPTGCGTAEPRTQGAGRRCGHPPPAPDDRAGHHVHEPRGRDRADQRRRLEGLLGPSPRGGARCAPALLIRGRLERSEGVINIVAEQLVPLPVPASTASRDFR